jgi:malate dehydrogenase
MSNAPKVPRDRWYAMTRLDQNRAVSQIAHKAGVPIAAVKNVNIWGNHSATQFPDVAHGTINGQQITSLIKDDVWLKGDFIKGVQQRGAAVIAARGASSAASAANAALDTVKSVVRPTPASETFSAAVCSNGDYGIDAGLIFSFPLTSDGTTWSVVKGQEHDAFAQEKIQVTLQELRDERDAVKDMLN